MPLKKVGRGGARAARTNQRNSSICLSSVAHLFLICLSSVAHLPDRFDRILLVHPGLAERQFGSRALPELGEPGQPSPTDPSRQQWRARAGSPWLNAMEEKPLSTSHQAMPVRQHQALPVQHQVLRSSFFVLISALHGLAAAAVVCFMRTGGPAATLATCRRIIALSACASCIRLLKLILSACLATPAPGPASALDFEEHIAQVCREYPDIYERAKADALNRNLK